MALTSSEQELFDFALAGLPAWFQDDERAMEDLAAMAVQVGAARTQQADWFPNTLIGDAVGAVGDDPDWLNEHARDRGTSRQESETDPALRERIRNVGDVVTVPALLDAAQAIVDADSVVGTVYMVELRRDKAFIGSFTSDSGTGGVFLKVDATTMNFTPTAGWARPPYENRPPGYGYAMVISGAGAGVSRTIPNSYTPIAPGAWVLLASKNPSSGRRMPTNTTSSSAISRAAAVTISCAKL